MTMWLLIFTWSSASAVSVNGLASREACEDLMQRIAVEYNTRPSYKCFEYRAPPINRN